MDQRMVDRKLKYLLGENVIRIPAWMKIQSDENEQTVSFVGASRLQGSHPLSFGSKKSHILMVGEIIVRPHLVMASNEFRSIGVSGLLCQCPTDWKGQEILIGDPTIVGL